MNRAGPISPRKSALAIRVARHLSLDADEEAALDMLEGVPQKLTPGEPLLTAGDPVVSLFVVQQGWLHLSNRLPDGTRQILRFHYPGDLIGTSSIPWHHAGATLTAVSDCIVTPVRKADLGRLFARHGRIGGFLYAMAAAESVAMGDRLTSVGRTDALHRLATLLLDIRARLRSTAGGVVDTIELPLTQTDIGDALGLTKVHVNRTFREMEERGMIARAGKRVTLLDDAALVAFTGFVDRYASIATDWLPEDAGPR
ncbi:CRP/FNR family transcriptional regulator [Sphingomonas sp. SORGH_AS802]|uniref:Crp/Fnr family transcriptional regulator n=1 Tax=unclassified Sphingomonas TaxID=196159 RepID=UPI00286469A1|nr:MULTISPECIES: Crp/Fnr family transcriptional regulator [unclassified Sphingomonas]MDR6128911.1 CRP/FNR family transcriptional regulator [Sphingomonas sp. SORGH_AS_0438]MDR6136078.1 CRP/FNR family transcriptional regulator [Sphingomonas sp. SORGH_AS_0802]